MSNVNQSRSFYLRTETIASTGRALLSALALATLVSLPACQQGDELEEPEADASAELEPEAPRSGELACVSYCEAREGRMREACEQSGHDAQTCEQLASAATGACIQRQCGIVPALPDPDGLRDLAQQFGHTVLGPEYQIVNVIPHYWDNADIGSRVYVFESDIDGSRAFVEQGASLELPPVVSYGHGEPADTSMLERAVPRLAEFYGEQDYQAGRAFFDAAGVATVLEYTTDQGSFYYSVATDDVSDTFDISNNPDVDPSALELRREGFKRQWERHLDGQFE